MAAKAKLSYDEQAQAAGRAAAKQAEAAGASARAQAIAYGKAADAAKAAAIRSQAANDATSHSFKGVGLAATAAAGLVVLGIKKSADTTAELAKETLTLHNVTGLSVKSASTYAAVAQTQGLNVKQLNQAFGTLSKNVHAVENAHTGLTKAAKTQENAFRQLGLPMAAITKAHGDLNKLLPQIINRFEHLPGSVNKAAIGMALFGRGWQSLVPLMHQGELGLKAQMKTAERMGATLGGSSVKNLKEFQRAQEEAKYGSLGLQLAIGQYLAPALTKLIVIGSKLVHGLGEGVHWLKEHQTAARALAVVVGGVLATAFTVFTVNKLSAFVTAISDAKGALLALGTRMGLVAGTVEASDAKIVAANETAGKSFMAMLGPIAAVVAALTAAQPLINKLTGGGLGENPQNDKNAGKIYEEQYGGTGKQNTLSKGGGIMGFFMSKGLSAAAAAGIVGNVQQESSFNPNAPGGGLFQYIGSRAASGRGSAYQQLEATWRELTGPYRSVLDELRGASSAREAARIFSEHFERPGNPMLSNRERYAEEALRSHPQSQGAPSGNLGYYEAPAPHAKARRGAAAPRMRRVTIPAEYVSPFGPASHLVRGREDMGIDFSATPGSSIGAIGAGIINAIIPNWYKGQPLIEELLTSGSHKGQHVYYAEQINPHVRVGQRVRPGQAIGTVAASGTGLELGFGAGGGRTLAQATTGYTEGQKTPAAEAFSKFLGSVGKTGTALQIASSVFEKAAAHLTLTAGQARTVHGLTGQAAAAHAEAAMYGSYASQAGEAWQRARALQVGRSRPLGTAQGNRDATQIDTQDVLTAKAQKVYYTREVAALGREVKAWQKLRASYLRFARHAMGHAKKEALDAAARYAGKIKEAQAQAKELHGTIADTEAAIETAQGVLSNTLPGEIGSADLSSYQAANNKIDAEVRAGILTEAQGKAAKEANANKALSGGYGTLTEEGVLQVKGDLREFQQAVEGSTNALEAHTRALEESAKALNEFKTVANQIGLVEAGSFAKATADAANGQIAGIGYRGRRLTPGAGTAARY